MEHREPNENEILEEAYRIASKVQLPREEYLRRIRNLLWVGLSSLLVGLGSILALAIGLPKTEQGLAATAFALLAAAALLIGALISIAMITWSKSVYEHFAALRAKLDVMEILEREASVINALATTKVRGAICDPVIQKLPREVREACGKVAYEVYQQTAQWLTRRLGSGDTDEHEESLPNAV